MTAAKVFEYPTSAPPPSGPTRKPADVVADRQAISDQLARYCYAFDERDGEAWARLFTDDGVFEVTLVGTAQPIFRAQGADQLRAFANGGAPPLLHHIGNLVVDELLPDMARTRAMVLGTWASPVDGSPAIYTHGTYEQRWAKVDGTWRIAFQRFISHGYHPAAFGRPPTAT